MYAKLIEIFSLRRVDDFGNISILTKKKRNLILAI